MKFLKSIHSNIVLIIMVFVLSGCASNCGGIEPSANQIIEPITYNFFGGLLHGIVLPFALIGSFINSCIEIYACNNTGWSYDLGYVIGVIFSLGGGMKASVTIRN